MSFKQKWCHLFAGSLGTIGLIGVTGTAFSSHYLCKGLVKDSMELFQKVLSSRFSFVSNVTMNLNVGPDIPALPASANNVNIDVMINLTQELNDTLSHAISATEQNLCAASIWQTGINTTLVLMILTAAVAGAVLSYHNTPETNPELRQELLEDQSNRHVI